MAASHQPLEHTADTGIRVEASTLAELFEECGRAMFGLMFDGEPEPVGSTFQVSATAPDRSELLVAWLSELLALAEAEEVALSDITVDELTDQEVVASVRGRPFGEMELAGPPVKAVTYHGLRVVRRGDGWMATVIFDV